MTTVPEGNTVDVSSGVQPGLMALGALVLMWQSIPASRGRWRSPRRTALFTADGWKPERRPRCGVATTHGGVAVMLPDTGEMQ